ncbi:MAG: hypothetical protein LIP23_00180, partial [Planctomycetes bacterium]|nr:hypothetical protein [Planctomycetota bacterium]
DQGLQQWTDDGGGPAFGSRKNEQALAVGLAVEIPNTTLTVRAEYAHGWNQGFNKYISSDNVNLGLAFRATPRLTLHGQGEWLLVRDRSHMADDGAGPVRDSRNNHLYRVYLGAEYELLSGLFLEGGWQYEYLRFNSARGDAGGKFSRSFNASMYYLGTKFTF